MANGDISRIVEHVVEGKRLGRHIHHDPRNWDYRAVVAELSVAPKVWHRHATVFDQGDLGSCTGNAIVGCASTDPTWKKGVSYSEKVAVKVYSKATTLDDDPQNYPPNDTGSTGLAACKAAVSYGLASEYLWGFGLPDMIGILSNLGPVAVGVNWYEGFDNPDAKGLVKVSGQVRGGHEFQVLGWHLNTVGGTVFEAQNSWGKSWGVKGTNGGSGRFFITEPDMLRLLHEGGDVVTLATNKL